MRKRDELLSQGWGQLVTPLLVDTTGGKQKLNYANAQGLLRIIQSIPLQKNITSPCKTQRGQQLHLWKINTFTTDERTLNGL